MFSVYVIGSRHHDDADMVKLTMIFYRSGYNRVSKVLSLSGLYREWDKRTHAFVPCSSENISKNKLLQKERIKYLNLAERWE